MTTVNDKLPATINFELSLKVGIAKTDVRSKFCDTVSFGFKRGETLATLKAQVVSRLPPACQYETDGRLYAKPSVTAAQKAYVELISDEDLAEVLEKCWRRYGARNPETFKFAVYLYGSKPGSQRKARTTTLRRATRNRIDIAADTILEFMDANPGTQARVGPLTQRYCNIHQSRQVVGTAQLPTSTVFQQLQRMDNLNEETLATQSTEFATIKVEIQGHLIDVNVSISSLRRALNFTEDRNPVVVDTFGVHPIPDDDYPQTLNPKE